MKTVIGGKLTFKSKKKKDGKKVVKKDEKAKKTVELSERRKKQIVKRVTQNIKMTHREKMKKYNNYLEGLNTNFDIPRVGPG